MNLQEERTEELINEINQLINIYKQTGKISEFAQLITGKQEDEERVIKVLQESREKQIYEMTKDHVAAKEFFKAFKINELSIQNAKITKSTIKKEKKEVLTEIMNDWSNKRKTNLKLLKEFYAYLAHQGETIEIDEYNPLKFFKGELGPKIKAIVDENALGTIGKCISYFDFDKQKFIFEGKRNDYFRLHNYETIEDAFKLPHKFLFEHDNGFGYHRGIRPNNEVQMFGGGRFILREKEIYFFHESGDYGRAHKQYIQHCIGKLNLNGTDFYEEAETSSGEFFLRETELDYEVGNTKDYANSKYKNQNNHQFEENNENIEINEENNLFSNTTSDPEDDLPF